MRKARVVLSLALLVLGAGSWFATCAPRPFVATQATAEEKPTLQDTLINGLQARRPQDVQFIQRVVQLVGNRTLKLKLVMETFNYVRKKYPTRSYKAQIFRIILTLRARKVGVRL